MRTDSLFRSDRPSRALQRLRMVLRCLVGQGTRQACAVLDRRDDDFATRRTPADTPTLADTLRVPIDMPIDADKLSRSDRPSRALQCLRRVLRCLARQGACRARVLPDRCDGVFVARDKKVHPRLKPRMRSEETSPTALAKTADSVLHDGAPMARSYPTPSAHPLSPSRGLERPLNITRDDYAPLPGRDWASVAVVMLGARPVNGPLRRIIRVMCKWPRSLGFAKTVESGAARHGRWCMGQRCALTLLGAGVVVVRGAFLAAVPSAHRSGSGLASHLVERSTVLALSRARRVRIRTLDSAARGAPDVIAGKPAGAKVRSAP